MMMVNEAIKTDELARRHARRELVNRSKSIDAWSVEMDGLTFWNGSKFIPYGIDTVAEIDSSLAGGPAGAYLLHSITLSRNVAQGDTASLKLLKRGIWQL